jgi:hypothetical protein
MTAPNKDSPDGPSVARFHKESDLNSSQIAQHHSLGIDHNQGSPGDHNHNGSNSKLIGAKINLSFPTTANAAYSQVQLQAVIDALRALGLGT